MKNLRLVSLVGIASIALAHTGWAAGPGGGGGGSGGGGFVGAATAEAEAPKEAELVAAEVESALADPPSVVVLLTNYTEACVTQNSGAGQVRSPAQQYGN